MIVPVLSSHYVENGITAAWYSGICSSAFLGALLSPLRLQAHHVHIEVDAAEAIEKVQGH